MSQLDLGLTQRWRARRDSYRPAAERQYTVLCGHTHSPGVFSPRPNVTVYTGAARYGHPVLQEVLTW